MYQFYGFSRFARLNALAKFINVSVGFAGLIDDAICSVLPVSRFAFKERQGWLRFGMRNLAVSFIRAF